MGELFSVHPHVSVLRQKFVRSVWDILGGRRIFCGRMKRTNLTIHRATLSLGFRLMSLTCT